MIGERLRRGCEALSQGLILAVVVLAPLPYGSAAPQWVFLWCAIAGMSLATADTRALSVLHRRYAAAVIALLAAWVAIALLQQAAPPLLGVPDPIWQDSAALLGDRALPPRIAATAQSPWPFFAMPLLAALVFLRVMLMARTTDGERRAMLTLTVAVPMTGILSYLAYRIDPLSLLGDRKIFYLGSFTGTFVNGNTAASFFGLGLILWSCRLANSLPERHRRSRRRTRADRFIALTDEVTPQRLAILLVWLACLGLTLATASRAGAVLSVLCAGLAGATVLHGRRRRLRISRRGLAIGGALSASALLLVLAGSLAERVDRNGLFDPFRLEVYRLCWNLVVEHPWLGIGAGAFTAVFPSVRSDTLGLFGIWDRAHSTPLELAVEMGLPFAVAVAAFWLATAIRLVRTGWRQGYPQAAIVGAAAALLAGLHSTIDFPLQTAGFLVPAVALTAAGIGRIGAFRVTVADGVTT